MTVGTKFENIQEMKMTVVLNGTVGEFEVVLNNLNRSYSSPMSNMIEAITEAVNNAKKNVSKEVIKS